MTMAVSDNGAGIAAEDLPKIFDRFYKGRGSRGSGLGLTIARNLVAAHGGEIRAESVGEGDDDHVYAADVGPTSTSVSPATAPAPIVIAAAVG